MCCRASGADSLRNPWVRSFLSGVIRPVMPMSTCRSLRCITGGRLEQLSIDPGIMTGAHRPLELIEVVLAGSETDLIGGCRPLIREPALANR